MHFLYSCFAKVYIPTIKKSKIVDLAEVLDYDSKKVVNDKTLFTVEHEGCMVKCTIDEISCKFEKIILSVVRTF